jgi:outer membrane protein, heavy metal efflux system
MRMDSRFAQRGFAETGALEPVHGTFHYLSAGAMVTLPLLNRNQGAVAAAEAERSAAAARLEAAELIARAEIDAAAAQDAQARRAREVIDGAVRLARQNLDVVRRTYELGRATASDVLAEQRRFLEIENAYTALLLSAFEARSALQTARGELP